MTPAEVISLLQAGEFTEIHDLFVPQLRPLVSAEAIQTAWAAALTEHGALIDVGEPTTEQGVTRILLTFERGRRTLVMTIGGDGQLGSLQLAPASAAEPVTPWQQPSYVDTSSFDEQEVTLGSGPLPVSGTLSLPYQPGPLPAIVLLSGSGAHDRDDDRQEQPPQ
jgi:hypothetical protein